MRSTDMDEPSTCGEGLAAHSVLYARLARLMATVGSNLELHLTAVDLRDDQSRPEFDAYTSLVERHRELAEGLRLLGDEMASYHDLPMANHDVDILAGPAVMEAFRALVGEQDRLASMLQEWVERDRAMLAAWQDDQNRHE